ncbi:hypothetical protein PSPO01_15628 [Paraphaeosphaeria sporulosa]
MPPFNSSRHRLPAGGHCGPRAGSDIIWRVIEVYGLSILHLYYKAKALVDRIGSARQIVGPLPYRGFAGANICSRATTSSRGRRRLSPPRGVCWEPVNALRRVFYRAEKSQYWLAPSAGQGWGWEKAPRPNHPQATREHFKNHPKHDREIDPTVGGHLGRGIGHRWGALGLLCRKEDTASPSYSGASTTRKRQGYTHQNN